MQPVLMLEQFWSCSSRFANNSGTHHIDGTIVTVHSAAELTTFRGQPNISATAQVRALAADHSITNKLNGRHGLDESFQWRGSTSIINCRGANVTSPLTGPTATRALIEESASVSWNEGDSGGKRTERKKYIQSQADALSNTKPTYPRECAFSLHRTLVKFTGMHLITGRTLRRRTLSKAWS